MSIFPCVICSGPYTLAGGKLTKNGSPVRITVLTSTLMQGGGDYLASVLSSLGFDVTLNNALSAPYGTNFIAGNYDLAVQRGQNPVPFPGPNVTSLIGAAPPAGTNSAATGVGDALYQRWAIAANQNLANCKYWYLVQRMMLQKHYSLPLVSWDFDIFGRKSIDFPPVSPDIAYPVWGVKAK
jgi:hypothetical protein